MSFQRNQLVLYYLLFLCYQWLRFLLSITATQLKFQQHFTLNFLIFLISQLHIPYFLLYFKFSKWYCYHLLWDSLQEHPQQLLFLLLFAKFDLPSHLLLQLLYSPEHCCFSSPHPAHPHSHSSYSLHHSLHPFLYSVVCFFSQLPMLISHLFQIFSSMKN